MGNWGTYKEGVMTSVPCHNNAQELRTGKVDVGPSKTQAKKNNARRVFTIPHFFYYCD